MNDSKIDSTPTPKDEARFERMEHTLGYFFFPKTHAQSPGHPRLDILLSESPTHAELDPVRVQLPVRKQSQHDKTSEIDTLVVQHPWRYADEFQVCAGRVIITDRNHKHSEAFTFGGTLFINQQSSSTECILTSPVPIIDLQTADPIHNLIVEEVEILFARRRVTWHGKPRSFELKLLSADPSTLYAACLQAIYDNLHAPSYPRSEKLQEFLNNLHIEIQYLKEHGDWPDPFINLAELL